MSARIRLTLAALVALGTAPLAASAVRAQSDTVQPGSTGQHNLGENPNASNIINQTTPSSGNLLTVPLSHVIPGGVKVPKVESPVHNDTAAVQRGKQYFIGFNCVGCHADNGAGGMGPALSNRFFKFGSHPSQMFNVISHGAPLGMPAWGSVLPDSAIWDIIAYIQSISQAPSSEWGTTVNASEHMPAIEQVPAEFESTTQPWKHTEPFSSGHKPTSHNPTSTTDVPSNAKGS